MSKEVVVVVDFDGTVVEHDFPRVGKSAGAEPWLKEAVEAGAKLVLFTMRDDELLDDAVKWFDQNDIPLWGIQTNPTQHTWTSSPKAHGHIFVDDRNLGVPLRDATTSGREVVDWLVAGPWLLARIDELKAGRK